MRRLRGVVHPLDGGKLKGHNADENLRIYIYCQSKEGKVPGGAALVYTSPLLATLASRANSSKGGKRVGPE